MFDKKYRFVCKNRGLAGSISEHCCLLIFLLPPKPSPGYRCDHPMPLRAAWRRTSCTPSLVKTLFEAYGGHRRIVVTVLFVGSTADERDAVSSVCLADVVCDCLEVARRRFCDESAVGATSSRIFVTECIVVYTTFKRFLHHIGLAHQGHGVPSIGVTEDKRLRHNDSVVTI